MDRPPEPKAHPKPFLGRVATLATSKQRWLPQTGLSAAPRQQLSVVRWSSRGELRAGLLLHADPIKGLTKEKALRNLSPAPNRRKEVMTAKSPRILCLGLWLAIVVAPEGLHAALKPEKLYQKVLPSVMTLEVENQRGEKFVGSAVLALADDVAMTAWHVVADARSVWAVFADGQRVKVTGFIDHDGLRDLALLKLEKRLPHRQAVLCRELQSVAARAY